jgi:hypothetical protein
MLDDYARGKKVPNAGEASVVTANPAIEVE